MATFDIFEALRDGSYVSRASVSGCAERDRKLQELTKTSTNQFCAIACCEGETLPPGRIGPATHHVA